MNTQITHYETVMKPTLLQLDDTVNALIAIGWQPFGSLLNTRVSESSWAWVQPMVKYAIEEPPA